MLTASFVGFIMIIAFVIVVMIVSVLSLAIIVRHILACVTLPSFFFFFDNWKCLSLKSNYFPANGVLLCRLARKIDEGVAEWRYETRSSAPVGVPIHYHENAPPGSDTSCGAFVFVVIEPCSCC